MQLCKMTKNVRVCVLNLCLHKERQSNNLKRENESSHVITAANVKFIMFIMGSNNRLVKRCLRICEFCILHTKTPFTAVVKSME
jgi:hypothetical protein